MSVECVGSFVASDDVVTGTGIDVFNRDQPITAITGVLPACGVEVDAIGV